MKYSQTMAMMFGGNAIDVIMILKCLQKNVVFMKKGIKQPALTAKDLDVKRDISFNKKLLPTFFKRRVGGSDFLSFVYFYRYVPKILI